MYFLGYKNHIQWRFICKTDLLMQMFFCINCVSSGMNAVFQNKIFIIHHTTKMSTFFDNEFFLDWEKELETILYATIIIASKYTLAGKYYLQNEYIIVQTVIFVLVYYATDNIPLQIENKTKLTK
jgi:hypothetical protein